MKSSARPAFDFSRDDRGLCCRRRASDDINSGSDEDDRGYMDMYKCTACSMQGVRRAGS